MTEELKTIEDIRNEFDNVRTVMVTTIDERGTLSSRPITLQDIDINGDVWLLVDRNADWVKALNGGAINVSATKSDAWASFAGRAFLVTEQSRVDMLMSRVAKAFFAPDAEPAALRIATDRIEWWTADGRIVTALEIAKALVTGGSVDAGQSGAIEA